MRRSESVVGPQLAFAEPVCNRGLFADHFLKERLADLPEWQEPEGLEEAFEAVNKLYQDRVPSFTDATNESQTEHDFIQPVLDILWEEQEPGDCYQVQVSIPNIDAPRQPDYALFRHAAEREEAQGQHGTIEYWDDAACLGDAKRWSASLDKQRGHDENPSAQIANYLYRSKTRWGILTNGRIWRLYEQDKSRTGGVYYEVDLEAILQNKDREAFRHFYMFFRRESLLPDQAGKSFLEKVLQGSIDYATEVGDSLKESVYDALRLLMNGFCERRANDLDSSDADTLELVHENALIVLYRLLFVFFAEDRDLLPCDDEYYEGYSLRKLQGEINKQLRAGHPYLPTAINLWAQVCNLFALIDEGFELEGRTIIPAYNGGLFSPEKHPHVAHTPQAGVARWEVGDNRLAEIIDMLAYQRERWDEPGTSDVDYATLAVQHLGAIYEGLLELKPVVAEEPMIEQPGKSGKPPVVKKKSEVEAAKKVRGQNPREFGPGEIYPVTDRGERKATGSYYTPGYIVDYIVEHTVGPLAEEAAQEVARRWEKLKQKYELERPEQLDDAIAARKTKSEKQDVADEKASLFEPYLSLKVLDPAMGSGHFLVGAADFLSLAMATDPNLPEPQEIAEEEPQAYYKRLVVEHCLYGVDLNELAVELAKLSLWLHTVSKDKALSFLDHHLRCGNSLIGARLQEDLTKPPPTPNGKSDETGQLRLLLDETLRGRDLLAFLDTFRQIVEAPSGDADTERQKDVWFQQMERQRDRYRQVANLWLVPYFGAAVTAEQYGRALEDLRAGGRSKQWYTLTQEDWFKAAQEVARERHFFHWELEFPEAFFEVRSGRADWKPQDQRGFDAVIGNPPYEVLIVSEVGRDLLDFVQTYYSAAQYNPNTFALFLERGENLARHGGHIGEIVPDVWLTGTYFSNLRKYLADAFRLTRILLCAEAAFPEVIGTTMVLIAVAGEAEQSTVEVHELTDLADTPTGVVEVPKTDLPDDRSKPWCALLFTCDFACSRGEPLGSNWVVYRGLETVDNEKYLSNQPTTPEDRRIITGSRMDRYYIEWDGTYVRFIVAEMKSNADVAMYEVDEKILMRRTGSEILAALDRSGDLALKNLYVILPKDDFVEQTTCYVLALLNSCYMRARHCVVSRSQGLVYAQFAANYVEEFPIAIIDFEHPTEEGGKERLTERCRSAMESDDYDIPLELANRALATHAALYGPAGKPELKDDPYWAEQIAHADTSFPGREDFVHDLLAMLAQRMMDLNKEKHELVANFETDLRGQADADIHERLGKGKQGRTLYKHESCRPCVEEGSGSTHHLHETLGWSEEAFEDLVRELVGKVANLSDLVGVYRNYSEAYRRVTEALQKTDDLIDRIVYALYGLSAEEIEIVEASLG